MQYGTQYLGDLSSNFAVDLFIFIWAVIVIIADWKIFVKAGEAGWKSLIPIYRDYIQFKRFAGSVGMFWVYVIGIILSCIPLICVIGWLMVLIASIVLNYRKSLSFGKGGAFFLGLLIFTPLFDCILGFGKARYIGVRGGINDYNFSGTVRNDYNPQVIDVKPINPSSDQDNQ